VLIENKKEYKSRSITVRFTEKEYNEIKIKSKIYSDGSLSAFLRHVAFNYLMVVKKGEGKTFPPKKNKIIKDKPLVNL